MRRRSKSDRPAPDWTRQRMLALLIGAVVVALALMAGLVLTITYALKPSHSHGSAHASSTNSTAEHPSALGQDPRDVLADRPMPRAPEDAARPGPMSTETVAPIVVPASTRIGPAGLPTGFPHTSIGALAQLAEIDRAVLQSASIDRARAVIAAWSSTGGPDASTWSMITGLADLLSQASLSADDSTQLAIVATPVMGLIKGSVGIDFAVPCIDFELDVTLSQTARSAAADCQRMVWREGRWLIGPGAEPTTPPSVWPDTDTAYAVGYRDLRAERGHE
jgi:hypothetical protein